jgi:hypothetical protein
MPAPIVAYWEGLPAWITLGLAVFAALLLAIAIWWLWWRLPKREAARLALKIRDAKARADVEDNYRKTVGQALGGIAVLLGAGSAYLQFSQQQRASDRQSAQQQRASHESQKLDQSEPRVAQRPASSSSWTGQGAAGGRRRAARQRSFKWRGRLSPRCWRQLTPKRWRGVSCRSRRSRGRQSRAPSSPKSRVRGWSPPPR